MSDKTYECAVVNGQIMLPADVYLPESCRVWLTVREEAQRSPARIRSPHLAHPEQAKHFAMEVEDLSDA